MLQQCWTLFYVIIVCAGFFRVLPGMLFFFTIFEYSGWKSFSEIENGNVVRGWRMCWIKVDFCFECLTWRLIFKGEFLVICSVGRIEHAFLPVSRGISENSTDNSWIPTKSYIGRCSAWQRQQLSGFECLMLTRDPQILESS